MNPLQQLLKFLAHLESMGAGFMLSSDAETVIVLVRSDDGIHEVSFFGDGAIEVNSFAGSEDSESLTFAELLESFSADTGPAH